jgi:hypothetical protein
VRTKVPSSPASRHSTGISEPHQVAATPPGRNIWPHPQRPHGPATMETGEQMSSFFSVFLNFVLTYLAPINYRAEIPVKFVFLSCAMYSPYTEQPPYLTLTDPPSISLVLSQPRDKVLEN